MRPRLGTGLVCLRWGAAPATLLTTIHPCVPAYGTVDRHVVPSGTTCPDDVPTDPASQAADTAAGLQAETAAGKAPDISLVSGVEVRSRSSLILRRLLLLMAARCRA